MAAWALVGPLLLGLGVPALAQAPHLEKRGQATQLIVDGKPFLILGGELGNSSASDRAWLSPKWAKLKEMHLNTLLTPVSWELIEPEEGRFDFATVDWLIEDARTNGMHLVLLWFGAWKNSMSSYAPAWVKRDGTRFPRVAGPDGKPQEILSAFGEATLAADKRAFAALMAHVRKVDARGTVLMVQVENEIGMLPTAREPGAAIDAALTAPAPEDMLDQLPRAPSRVRWGELFPGNGEEAFQAWAYARYVNAVAEAGKHEYPLPMYANGAQPRPGAKPGAYPSGGPLAHLMRVWRKGAPALDFIAPDIYFPNFAEIADSYAQPGNTLFIPEANRVSDPRAPVNAMRVIGHDGAIGFSPFSIENADGVSAAWLGATYAMLDELAPEILAAQVDGRIGGFALPVAFDDTVDEAVQKIELGGYRLTVNFIDPWTPRENQRPSQHGGLILWLGGDDFLVAGTGITVTVEPVDGVGRVGLERVEEGHFVAGKWAPGRRLNGDETHQGRHLRLPPGAFGIQKVRLYRY